MRLFEEVVNQQSARTEIQSGLPSADQSPLGPLELQTTSVWSFPDRGTWGPHNGGYRGNWSPHVPRNLILKYTKPGELVLDPMVGSGTTLVECLLLGRRGLGVDVNPQSLMLAAAGLRRALPSSRFPALARLFHGDARDLNEVPPDSIDLVTLHPPYANIIRYSDGAIERDLSSIGDLNTFFEAIRKVAAEAFRVCKPGHHCAVLMGDTRRKGHIVPLSFRLFEQFLDVGFLAREHVIKLQWNTASERTTWASASVSFYKLAHEHLFVFRKPEKHENQGLFAASARVGTVQEQPA